MSIQEYLEGDGLTWEDERALLKERNAKARLAMNALYAENQELKARVAELEGVPREYQT